nr:Chain B, Hypoxia-inducible factor 1-alpha [Homo sapiens]
GSQRKRKMEWKRVKG